MKTRRYYFDDEPFIHPLHCLQFDSDRLYELPTESFSTLRRRESSKGKYPSLQRSGSSRRASPMPQTRRGKTTQELGTRSTFRGIWMCEGDEVGDKEEIKGIPASVDDVKGIEVEGKDEEEEEEDSKMNDPSLLMVIVSRAMIFLAFACLRLVQVVEYLTSCRQREA
ncbi:hypothetical protein PIB30_036172 [Stylosanthes scabra]|uniref:Uncharacterized protein n=1 Tax=Stylosanthes scabra TaxID=79078 RepID=A0ABU6QCY5_9FABA|nr:hypothetical protein [Stylosanthes scabra]